MRLNLLLFELDFLNSLFDYKNECLSRVLTPNGQLVTFIPWYSSTVAFLLCACHCVNTDIHIYSQVVPSLKVFTISCKNRHANHHCSIFFLDSLSFISSWTPSGR